MIKCKRKSICVPGEVKHSSRVIVCTATQSLQCFVLDILSNLLRYDFEYKVRYKFCYVLLGTGAYITYVCWLALYLSLLLFFFMLQRGWIPLVHERVIVSYVGSSTNVCTSSLLLFFLMKTRKIVLNTSELYVNLGSSLCGWNSALEECVCVGL